LTGALMPVLAAELAWGRAKCASERARQLPIQDLDPGDEPTP
jgi:hypothetical protein